MKYLTIILTVLTLLTACSMSGFKPPVNQWHWEYPSLGDKTYATKEELKEATKKYIEFAHKAMRECGIDPNVGDSTVTSKRICMQEKGWVYKKLED